MAPIAHYGRSAYTERQAVGRNDPLERAEGERIVTEWAPGALGGGPRYLRIVDALEADIAAGRVGPGARLPPQRELAERLAFSVGTVSKAYAEAERRGLIAGEVGRGTFVRRRQRNGADPLAPVNLALNAPPPTGAEALIASTLAEIARDEDFAAFTGYLPHQGLRHHRAAMGQWLQAQGIDASPASLFVTHGAQHALAISLAMVAGRGDIVLTEAATYSGMLALSAYSGVRLHGVEMDEEGVRPDALARAFATTGARVFYSTPTLQTPTSIVTGEGRRREIAEIVRREDAWLIEDDAYAFLFDKPPAPISMLIPDRAFYAVSFAKCLAPGLRVGAMLAPAALRDRVLNALRATGWMAAPIMAEVVTRLIANGGLARQVSLKREKAAVRYEIARRILEDRLRIQCPTPGFHVWAALPEGRLVTALVAEAALAGVSIAGAAPLLPLNAAMAGVRLCLGAPQSEAELESALRRVKALLENSQTLSLV